MKKFAKAAAIRAARTFAQSAAALVPATAVTLHEVHWATVASGAGLAAVLSLLTSVATGLPETE